jgi:subtilisin family serine protease
MVLPVQAQLDPVDPAALAKIHPPLIGQEGPVEVSIRLEALSLVEIAPKGSKRLGPGLSRDQQQQQLSLIRAQQDRLLAEVLKSGGTEVARVSKALNAVVVSINAAALPGLAKSIEVRSIRPLADYELHLDSTVPYIGAAIAQAAGFDGAGVKVAVLDSGIDYTHANLGGPGTLADFSNAWGTGPADPRNTTRDGLFPTAKVVEGYDFVGESWPTGPLSFDDDPIDFQGHGTHVADIIAGLQGVAPKASLYAYKVCSAVATSCSGVAILLGLDAALDPNGDNDISDAVDVVNLSLGSGYGQIADDSASAVQSLTEFGVVVVCSAGNSGDKPYVTGSPSVAPGAIAVAQTQVPDAKALSVTTTGAAIPGGTFAILNTATIDWAPVTEDVSGSVVAAGLGCAPFPAGTDFSGKVVLIDRGACSISWKVDHAARAGAAGVLIGNNVAGDPPSFSFGGTSDGAPFQASPTLVLTQTDANRLKSWLSAGVNAAFGPTFFTPLVGSMASTSSRGPSYSFNTIKPDIGAPGASVSAVAGSGNEVVAFGGTSGAAPMVSGAAALVLQKFPALLPHEVRARLMNSAEPAVTINPVTLPGVLAPATRIGAGEVRIHKALATEIIAYDAHSGAASVSFGYQALGASTEPVKIKRSLRLQNTGSARRKYTLASTFRYANDAALGAVSMSFSPKTISLNPGQSGVVQITLSVQPTQLNDWLLNSGTQGGNGETLRLQEIDGYITATSGSHKACLPWQILPRKAADSRIIQPQLVMRGSRLSTSFNLANAHGATLGSTDLFDLTGVSPLDYPVAPPAGSNQATPDLAAAGIRFLPEFDVLQFAIATHDERSHANYPAEFDIFLDLDNDGTLDAVLYNSELNGFTLTGQNVAILATYPDYTTVGIFYYTDADVNAQTAILNVPASVLGLSNGSTLGFLVGAFDNYFTGFLSDLITADDGGTMQYTLGQPRFPTASWVDVLPATTATVRVDYQPTATAASPSHSGILALHRNAKPGRWFDVLPIITE